MRSCTGRLECPRPDGLADSARAKLSRGVGSHCQPGYVGSCHTPFGPLRDFIGSSQECFHFVGTRMARLISQVRTPPIHYSQVAADLNRKRYTPLAKLLAEPGKVVCDSAAESSLEFGVLASNTAFRAHSTAYPAM